MSHNILNKSQRSGNENGTKMSITMRTIQRRVQFEEFVNQLKSFEMEQLQALDLLELKNGQLVTENKRLEKDLDFQKKMLYDTIRHVKLLESTLKQREKIIAEVYQYIRSQIPSNTLEQNESSEHDMKSENQPDDDSSTWKSDILNILNQEPIVDRVNVSQSLNQIQKEELYEKINSQRAESVSSWDIIRNGLKDVMDSSDFDMFLNSREKLLQDIFEKNRKDNSSREVSETEYDEIYSCDTLELNQQMIEKYGEKITQELLRKSEADKPTPISEKFSVNKAERDEQLEKIKHGSKIVVTQPPSQDGNGEAMEESVKANCKGAHPKWKSKVALRAHVDAVRSLSFHPSDELMVSSSEDGTVKLWQFKKLKSSSKRAPLHTYLGHTGPVFSTACAEDYLFTTGYDGTIRIYIYPPDRTSHDWKELHNRIIPYNVCNILNAHDDIIWKLALDEGNQRLLSASSDGTVKLWDYKSLTNHEQNPDITCNATQILSSQGQVPTTVSFYDISKCIIGFASGDVSCFDIEKGKTIWSSQLAPSKQSKACYQLETHKQLQLGISCHEDGKLRWLDLRNSGSVAHEVVAHQDAVACLSIDTCSGMYIATGGHDCRVRFWDLQTRQCLQDLSCHRPKNEEGIHDIIYHPRKQLLATAGADSQIRLFQ